MVLIVTKKYIYLYVENFVIVETALHNTQCGSVTIWRQKTYCG